MPTEVPTEALIATTAVLIPMASARNVVRSMKLTANGTNRASHVTKEEICFTLHPELLERFQQRARGATSATPAVPTALVEAPAGNPASFKFGSGTTGIMVAGAVVPVQEAATAVTGVNAALVRHACLAPWQQVVSRAKWGATFRAGRSN